LPSVGNPTKTNPHVQKIDRPYVQREKDFTLCLARDRACRFGMVPLRGAGLLESFASGCAVSRDPLI
jgi:hypothetical protein